MVHTMHSPNKSLVCDVDNDTNDEVEQSIMAPAHKHWVNLCAGHAIKEEKGYAWQKFASLDTDLMLSNVPHSIRRRFMAKRLLLEDKDVEDWWGCCTTK